MEYKEYKLKDLCDIIDSLHKTPSYEAQGIPMIRVKDLYNGYFIIPKEAMSVSEEVYEEFSKRHKPAFNDILMSRVGTYGLISLVKTEDKFCLGQNTLVMTNFSENILSEYLFYFLISPYGKELIEKSVSGSTQKTISLKSINNFDILVPKIDYQKSIIRILSSFYNKIETNNKIIANLEAQAQALFKYYFIDFEPFADGNFVDSELGPIPEGWVVKKIGDCIDFDIGGGWGKEKEDESHIVPAYVIRGADLEGIKTGSFIKDNYRYHKENNYKKRKLESGDIVFESSGGSPTQVLGRLLYINDKVLQAYNDDVMCASFCKLIRINDKAMGRYVYNILNYAYHNKLLVKYEVQSTGLANFAFTNFKEDYNIVFPSRDVLEKFYKNTFSSMEYSANLSIQNQTLAQARDELLPRLMAGEIDLEGLGGSYD